MSEKLDVLIVTQFFPPESMGGAHRWEKLAANLDEDIEPHVLCTHPTFPFGEFERTWSPLIRESVTGIPVTRLVTYQPRRDTVLGRILNYGIFSVLSTLYVLLNFWRYDCIITMSAPHTTFLPGLVGKLTGCTWVIDIFDLWIDNAADLGYVGKNSLEYKLVSWLERVSFTYADGVIVITETMAEYYGEKYPELSFDTHIIPFGVDTEMFSPDVEPIGSTDLIYTGNLGTGQAFTPFFEGFARLDSDTELAIIGDGERREELEALTKELDIDERVSFLGYIPRDEIPGRLAGAEISLVPLKTSYQLDYARPTKLLESMAVGIPYIASNVREIEKLSKEYDTGFAIRNSAEDAETALVTLLSDESVRERMGGNSRRFIKMNHRWDGIGSEVSEVLVGMEMDAS